MMGYPRIIEPGRVFDSLAEWFFHHGDCPGVLVGLSGTDSLVTFLAAYRGFEKAGMQRELEVGPDYIEKHIPLGIQVRLKTYIRDQVRKAKFKGEIPYTTSVTLPLWGMDQTVIEFENWTLDISKFNHSKHIYIAWVYLKSLPFREALDRYAKVLEGFLTHAGYPGKFNLKITEAYFAAIDFVMRSNRDISFEDLEKKLAKMNMVACD